MIHSHGIQVFYSLMKIENKNEPNNTVVSIHYTDTYNMKRKITLNKYVSTDEHCSPQLTQLWFLT